MTEEESQEKPQFYTVCPWCGLKLLVGRDKDGYIWSVDRPLEVFRRRLKQTGLARAPPFGDGLHVYSKQAQLTGIRRFVIR